MPPKLFRVLVPVSDIDSAVDFYAAVLGIDGERISPGRHYFDCEGTILACYDPKADGDERSASPNLEHIYLAVNDLEETYTRCAAAGAEFDPSDRPGLGPMGEIARRPWGERSFYLYDPFGNPICFVDGDTVFLGN